MTGREHDEEGAELLEAAALELHIQTIALDALSESVVAALTSEQRQRIDRVHTHGIVVRGDRARLRLALLNLLRMVLSCSVPGSRVTVREVQHGSRASITISAAAYPRASDRLALEIARKIANAHGGTAAAAALDELVTWCIELPASSAPPRRAVVAGRTVLLVDDDREQVNALAEVLRSQGLSVDYVVSGREAIDRLAQRIPDFLIVDARLPDYDGTDVINHARALKPELPTALLTGYPPDHPPIARALATTRSAYLGKPVDVHALLELVASAMR